jgi:hypothetical protein
MTVALEKGAVRSSSEMGAMAAYALRSVSGDL